MASRFFAPTATTLALALAAAFVMPSQTFATSRDKRFFDNVAGTWTGPGEIVAGKYKGTRFTCNLTGISSDGSQTGLTLDGTCRVGVFSQPMKATISEVGSGYQGKFLDGASGKGLDIVSGTVSGNRVVMGINRSKLNGAMVAHLQNQTAMNITISVRVEDQLVPVIGLKLNRRAAAKAD